MKRQKSDEIWRKDGKLNCWKLPLCASILWRLPVIRHIRVLWLAKLIERHRIMWSRFGLIDTGYDSWVLYAIARGWC